MAEPTAEELDNVYEFAVQLGKETGQLLLERAQARSGDGPRTTHVSVKESSVDIVTQTDEGQYYVIYDVLFFGVGTQAQRCISPTLYQSILRPLTSFKSVGVRDADYLTGTKTLKHLLSSKLMQNSHPISMCIIDWVVRESAVLLLTVYSRQVRWGGVLFKGFLERVFGHRRANMGRRSSGRYGCHLAQYRNRT